MYRYPQCLNLSHSPFFSNLCDWSSSDAFSSEKNLCKQYANTNNLSRLLYGRNFYLIGNSVTRHYSFNIKYLLDENLEQKDIKLTREEEKLKCGFLIDGNSCTHIVKNNVTTVKFMWMGVFGEIVDSTDRRDVCIMETSTKSCLLKKFNGSKPNDVLIISTPIVNSSSYPGNMMNFSGFFEKIVKSQQSFVNGPISAHKTLEILTTVFPGAIIWLPYPYYTGNNGLVEEANNFTRAVIESFCSERIIFLNTFTLLKENSNLYSDFIHHPGKLSDMVVHAIFSTLKQLSF